MNINFSVIIPVYNTELYLTECIDSVLLQETERSYEVILVDDGSTDASGAICDRYAEGHENICVVHSENRGVSHARNLGLAQARGEYILFLDSDDMWTPGLLDTVGAFLPDAPDVVLFDFSSFGNQKCVERKSLNLPVDSISGHDYLLQLIDAERMPYPFIWCYAYRRSLIENNRLFFREDLTISEDFDFNMKALECAASVVGTGKKLYLYRQRAESAVRDMSSEKLLMNLKLRAEYFEKYPSAITANKYYNNAVCIPKVADKAYLRQCMEHVRQHAGKITPVSGGAAKLARFLICAFGVRCGTGIYMLLSRIKHLLFGDTAIS